MRRQIETAMRYALVALALVALLAGGLHRGRIASVDATSSVKVATHVDTAIIAGRAELPRAPGFRPSDDAPKPELGLAVVPRVVLVASAFSQEHVGVNAPPPPWLPRDRTHATVMVYLN